METTGGSQTFYIYGLGLAFQVNPDGTHRYYHADSLGSTRVVTDDAGNPVSAYNYDAYGAVRQSAGEGKAFTYTGEQLDTETSMVFLRARYYDPQTGRFLSRDSIVPDPTSSQGINRYTYASGAPTRYSDPSGHGPDPISSFLMALWENLNPANATPAGGDLYDENGQPCGDTGCVPPAPSESEVYGRAATDALTMDVTGRATGAAWNALKPPAAAGLQKLGNAASCVLRRAEASASVAIRPIAGGEASEAATKAKLADLIEQAKALYPNKAGKIENHHSTPIYLGGAQNGMTVDVDAAYHQVITNEFRRRWSYGTGDRPNPEELQKILREVYDKYPLP